MAARRKPPTKRQATPAEIAAAAVLRAQREKRIDDYLASHGMERHICGAICQYSSLFYGPRLDELDRPERKDKPVWAPSEEVAASPVPPPPSGTANATVAPASPVLVAARTALRPIKITPASAMRVLRTKGS